MKKTLVAISLVTLVLFVNSCSLFVPRSSLVKINTVPDGAIVRYDGQSYKTPFAMKVPKNRSFHCTVSKEGYEKEALTSYQSLSATGVLDIIGGFLFIVPFAGFLSPGAYTLQQTEWNIDLVPVE